MARPQWLLLTGFFWGGACLGCIAYWTWRRLYPRGNTALLAHKGPPTADAHEDVAPCSANGDPINESDDIVRNDSDRGVQNSAGERERSPPTQKRPTDAQHSSAVDIEGREGREGREFGYEEGNGPYAWLGDGWRTAVLEEASYCPWAEVAEHGLAMDLGSSVFKAGSGAWPAGGPDGEPQLLWSNRVGSLRGGGGGEGSLVGEECDDKLLAGDLIVSSPIVSGAVASWSGLEAIAGRAYAAVGATSAEVPLALVTNGGTNVEALAQLFFETFQAPSILITCQEVAGLASQRKATGLCLSLGHSHSRAVAVYRGIPISHSSITNKLTGQRIVAHVRDGLDWDAHSRLFGPGDQRSRTRITQIAMASRMTVLSLGGHAPRNEEEVLREGVVSTPSKLYHELPPRLAAGVDVEKGNRLLEALFRPQLMLGEGHLARGIHEVLFAALEQCPAELMPLMLDNVTICGGLASLPGLAARVQQELTLLATAARMPAPRVRSCGPQSDFAAWRGARLLQSVHGTAVTQEQYNEEGPVVCKHAFAL